jgi:PmbA protein
MSDHDERGLLGDAHALLSLALKAGADYADVVAIDARSLSVEVLNGSLDTLEQSESRELGVRAVVGRRQAVAATRLISADSLEACAADAVAMAKLAPEDPHLALTPPGEFATALPDLDLADERDADADRLLSFATAAEAAGLAVAGVTRSDGGRASAARRLSALVASNGFAGAYRKTTFGIDASMIAAGAAGMERGSHWTAATRLAGLDPAEAIGREAGARAARRVDPRLPASQRVPVIYDARAASGLVSHLVSAVSGDAVARGTSFLKDRLGERLFRAGVSIIDDALRPRHLASRPFDAEGRAAPGRTALIEDGVLATFLLDNRSAAMLGKASTRHATRSPGGVPAPSAYGVTLASGGRSPRAMIESLAQGFLVTDLFGMGVNPVTGDYSRGASGFWIENGELAWPVSGVTVASNLVTMFAALEPADDLTSHGRMACPSVFVGEMMVAGA